MQAIQCVAAIPVKIKRSRPEGVVRTAFKPAGIRTVSLGLTPDHVRRRRPAGPFRLACDDCAALEVEALLAADADAVADGSTARPYEIGVASIRIDNDRSCWLVRRVDDLLPEEGRIGARQVDGRDREG